MTDAGNGDQGNGSQGQGQPDGAAQGQGSSDGGQQQSGSDGSAAVIARLNAEAKDWRLKFEGAQTRLTEIEQANMSDLEKARAQAADAEARAQAAETASRGYRVAGAAAKAAVDAKALDPALIANLIDMSKVEFDQEGNPTNLSVMIGELKSKHPILFGPALGSADGGARGGSAAPSSDMNELIRRGAHRG